jgi:hypothetical protein
VNTRYEDAAVRHTGAVGVLVQAGHPRLSAAAGGAGRVGRDWTLCGRCYHTS